MYLLASLDEYNDTTKSILVNYNYKNVLHVFNRFSIQNGYELDVVLALYEKAMYLFQAICKCDADTANHLLLTGIICRLRKELENIFLIDGLEKYHDTTLKIYIHGSMAALSLAETRDLYANNFHRNRSLFQLIIQSVLRANYFEELFKNTKLDIVDQELNDLQGLISICLECFHTFIRKADPIWATYFMYPLKQKDCKLLYWMFKYITNEDTIEIIRWHCLRIIYQLLSDKIPLNVKFLVDNGLLDVCLSRWQSAEYNLTTQLEGKLIIFIFSCLIGTEYDVTKKVNILNVICEGLSSVLSQLRLASIIYINEVIESGDVECIKHLLCYNDDQIMKNLIKCISNNNSQQEINQLIQNLHLLLVSPDSKSTFMSIIKQKLKQYDLL